MIDTKAAIVSALKQNANLVNLLGGQRVYQIAAPNAEEFPRITLFEVTNLDSTFADDQATSSEIHIQVDIWSKSNYTQMSLEVDNTMKSLQYQRTGTVDFYETDTGVFHKAMRYTTAVPVEG